MCNDLHSYTAPALMAIGLMRAGLHIACLLNLGLLGLVEEIDYATESHDALSVGGHKQATL